MEAEPGRGKGMAPKEWEDKMCSWRVVHGGKHITKWRECGEKGGQGGDIIHDGVVAGDLQGQSALTYRIGSRNRL